MAIARYLFRGSMILALCIALSLVGGCSALRVGYNQAEWLAFRWLDSYAAFDDAQAPRVREALASWFAWHRRTQLADYSDLLLRIDAEVLADTNAERVCAWWGAVKIRIDRGTMHAVPAIAEVALTLKPAQLEGIERRQAKANAEYRDDYMQADPVLRSSEAAKRAAGRFEWLYGDLDSFQRERLERWMVDSPFDPKLTFDERRHRQQDALQTLRRLAGEPVDSATAQTQIRDWLQRADRSPREAHRLYSERVVQHNCRLAANLHNSTSPAQRQAASKKLRGWAADLRALRADAGE